MKTVPGSAFVPVILIAQLACAQDDDAPQPLAIDADTTRLLLYRSGEEAFPGYKSTERDRRAHQRGKQQLLVRELYADYFGAQALTPSQADDLVRALAEERTLIGRWTYGGTTHEPSDDDLRAAEDLRARQEDLLGKERFAALVQYQDTLPERMQLQQLSHWLRVLGHELSPEQKESLVAIMKAESYRIDATLAHAPDGTLEHAVETVELYDSFDRHVRQLFDPILTAEQREIADRQFAERRERRHDALDRYARSWAQGDRQPFAYPVD